MDEVNLFVISLNAFVAVLILLSVLALAMRLLTALFPPPPTSSGAAATVAVVTAVSALFPGARVTRIEAIEGGPKR